MKMKLGHRHTQMEDYVKMEGKVDIYNLTKKA
jgi:hypothetical protein